MPQQAVQANSAKRAFLCTWGCVLALWAAVLACAMAPAEAFAYFNQVSDNSPAQQDIGAYGAAIVASQIPEGTYTIAARTTSRMCVFYNTASDAATRSSNKELCTISVAGGSMTATFYLSPAYTHIFMGSGEQAAQLTDAAGIDDSAYVRGEAVPIATSAGTSNAYRYTMAVPALNTPISFASFNGGSAGVENGEWYDRAVVLIAGDEVLDAIARAAVVPGGSGTSSDPSDDPTTDPDPDPDPGSDSDPDPESDSGSNPDPDPDSHGSGADEKEPGSPKPGGGSTAADAGSTTRRGPGARQEPSAQDADADAQGAPRVASELASEGGVKSSSRLRGTLITPAEASAQVREAEASVVAVAAGDVSKQVSPAVVCGLVLAGIALAGAVARVSIYTAEKGGKLT